MKIAFFSLPNLTTAPISTNTIRAMNWYFLEAPLNEQTVNLASGFTAVCAFVNDAISAAVIEQLTTQGVQLIALRCAEYNSVDLACC